MSFSADDHRFMAQALLLAQRGMNTTTPNPRVGCVIVKEGQIISEGWHEKTGGPHAEAVALANLTANLTTSLSTSAAGATVYVTLEPCSHIGRTPPCADALIAAGVTRVVAAMQDPNPQVAGKGLARLGAAGITAECGLLSAEAHELNIGFVSRMTRGRPWLRLKIAASLDGKTALKNGVSQWITSAEARQDAHLWRARSCALLTGIGTVKDDNPRLTVRGVNNAQASPRSPLKVIVDSQLQTPLDAAVLANGGVLIACATDHPARRDALTAAGAEIIVLPAAHGKVDLAALLTALGQRGINEVLVEAGARLNGALLRDDCVDELLLYQAPLLLGDAARGMINEGEQTELTTLTDARRLHVVERRSISADFFIRARFL
ncbi:MAG: bifunctional diaminohydroxyphosphoribosylaminopyrimidine deaminase/5-amino-6-(5-phosphoribosylamino)uracil reductase RibD [Rugosibacter sp.]|jgi:diaminohydroxyphosphoribosylaminopyrimidine deaminase/5-amino-6-(5-phosphoribosylamino)uracil reductase|nr:bifunctional diaminohydroxyphosphoribosylaminopyrimidine deaminase/5-amino-6-(5-phosphoribosylamino)uracil reductase RibD [Rugosibacter sp.]